MDLVERIIYLCVGGVLGWFANEVVGYLRAINNKEDEVIDLLRSEHGDTPPERVRDETGLIRLPKFRNIALFIVVAMTVFAAVQSQRASNKVVDTQDVLETVTTCNTDFLGKAFVALNERTEFSRQASNKNIKLQKAQRDFLEIVLILPPVPDEDARAALTKYFDGVTEFVNVSNLQKARVAENPYPTEEELNACIEKGVQKKEQANE